MCKMYTTKKQAKNWVTGSKLPRPKHIYCYIREFTVCALGVDTHQSGHLQARVWPLDGFESTQNRVYSSLLWMVECNVHVFVKDNASYFWHLKLGYVSKWKLKND